MNGRITRRLAMASALAAAWPVGAQGQDVAEGKAFLKKD